MPLKVTLPDKPYRYELEGSTIIYKKLPFLEKKRILFKHMVNGTIPTEDSLDLGYDVMRAMITGWEGVVDEDGNDIAYDASYIEGIEPDSAMKFLDEVIMPDFNKMAEAAKKQEKANKKKGRDREEELKNSEPM